VNLASGEKKEYPRIRRFAFNGEAATHSRCTGRRHRPPEGRAAPAAPRLPRLAARVARLGPPTARH
jgi:hypothetical protein